MFMPVETAAYISLLISQGLSKPIVVEKSYKPYTTTRLMINDDMYNVQEILEQILIKEIKQEDHK